MPAYLLINIDMLEANTLEGDQGDAVKANGFETETNALTPDASTAGTRGADVSGPRSTAAIALAALLSGAAAMGTATQPALAQDDVVADACDGNNCEQSLDKNVAKILALVKEKFSRRYNGRPWTESLAEKLREELGKLLAPLFTNGFKLADGSIDELATAMDEKMRANPLEVKIHSPRYTQKAAPQSVVQSAIEGAKGALTEAFFGDALDRATKVDGAWEEMLKRVADRSEWHADVRAGLGVGALIDRRNYPAQTIVGPTLEVAGEHNSGIELSGALGFAVQTGEMAPDEAQAILEAGIGYTPEELNRILTVMGLTRFSLAMAGGENGYDPRFGTGAGLGITFNPNDPTQVRFTTKVFVDAVRNGGVSVISGLDVGLLGNRGASGRKKRRGDISRYRRNTRRR